MNQWVRSTVWKALMWDTVLWQRYRGDWWLLSSCVWLTVILLCMIDCYLALYDWQLSCCVWLTVTQLCMIDGYLAVYDWLLSCSVWLTVILLCLIDSYVAVYDWRLSSCVWFYFLKCENSCLDFIWGKLVFICLLTWVFHLWLYNGLTVTSLFDWILSHMHVVSSD